MADTLFVNGTPTAPDWFNDVNRFVYDAPAVGGAALVGANDLAAGVNFDTVQEGLTYINGRVTTLNTAVTLKFSRERVLDLRIGMDAIYGVNLWTERTGVGVGSDIGPAIDYLCDNSPTRTEIYIPPGTWRMMTSPSAAKIAGRRISGAGSQASKIVYGLATGIAFSLSGAAGFTGGGLSGLSISLEESLGDTTATAIYLVGTATDQPDQLMFSDLYITALGAAGAGSSHWSSGFYADGVARTSPQGIRVANLENIQVFRCHGAGVYLRNIVQWSITNLGLYAGKLLGMNLYIAGGGAALTNSTQVYIRGLSCQELNITNSSGFEVSGKFSTYATALTTTSGRVYGIGATLSGSLGTNSTFTAA